jgi:hypothetical protein
VRQEEERVAKMMLDPAVQAKLKADQDAQQARSAKLQQWHAQKKQSKPLPTPPTKPVPKIQQNPTYENEPQAEVVMLCYVCLCLYQSFCLLRVLLSMLRKIVGCAVEWGEWIVKLVLAGKLNAPLVVVMGEVLRRITPENDLYARCVTEMARWIALRPLCPVLGTVTMGL